jgi:hypothetical protein
MAAPTRPLQWTPLPPHGGVGPVRHVALALGTAGVFLAATTDDGPRVLHASLSGDRLDWSAPTPIPPLPPRRGAGGGRPESWTDYADSLDGVSLAIDEHDPLRLAVNLLEYQGGSFGVVVGKLGAAFRHVTYPHHESDIRFGQPMILRGPELISHDTSALWQFRILPDRVDTRELPLEPITGELGWSAVLSRDGHLLFVAAFGSLLVLSRKNQGEHAGAFALDDTLDVAGTIEALAIARDGRATVLVSGTREIYVVTYGRGGLEERGPVLTCPEMQAASHSPEVELSTDGRHALVPTSSGVAVFDVETGHHTQLATPTPLDRNAVRACAMHGAHAVVATTNGVGLYRVDSALH